jgi:hypothetical protein
MRNFLWTWYNWSSVETGFIGAFAKLKTAIICFVVCVWLSIRTEQVGFHWAIFVKLCIFLYFENLSRKFKFHWTETRITGTLQGELCTFVIIPRLLLEWEMFQTKMWRKWNRTFYVQELFDVLTSNISFLRVPKTEKCDVTASNGTHQSANSRRGHMT